MHHPPASPHSIGQLDDSAPRCLTITPSRALRITSTFEVMLGVPVDRLPVTCPSSQERKQDHLQNGEGVSHVRKGAIRKKGPTCACHAAAVSVGPDWTRAFGSMPGWNLSSCAISDSDKSPRRPCRKASWMAGEYGSPMKSTSRSLQRPFLS